jgi:hypothetical protein
MLLACNLVFAVVLGARSVSIVSLASSWCFHRGLWWVSMSYLSLYSYPWMGEDACIMTVEDTNYQCVHAEYVVS